MSVLRELFEEQGQESIDVLACSDCVADRAPTIGETGVHGLIEENDGSISIP